MPLHKISDSVLVSRYINGEEANLEILINKYQHRIYSFIYSKVHDKDITEDIFQDTFIKVIKTLKKGTYREEGKFFQWVMRIAHNLIIDHFRKLNKKATIDTFENFDIFDIIGDDTLNVENRLVKEQVYQDVRNLIEELPDDQREVLIMRIYKDMSFKEIADITDVSINTALGRMRYALINLRKLIEKHQIVLHTQ